MDAWSRLAWLLVTLRLHPTRGEPVSRSEIVSVLHSRGVAADPTRVSRWESGQVLLPTRVLLAYEQCLQLPAGALVALARTLLRSSLTQPGAAASGASAPDEVPPDEVLEQLIARVSDSRADSATPALGGGEWLRMAIELETYQRVFLDGALWSRICRRLLVELARTSGSAQLLRLETCATLLGHPLAQRRMLPVLDEWLTGPGTGFVDPMVGLLGTTSDPAASELVLRFMNSRRPLLRERAARAAATKLARGQLGPGIVAELEQYTITGLSQTRRVTGPGLLDLLAHLPRESMKRATAVVADRALQRQLRAVCSTMLLAPAEMSRGVARSMAESARSRVAHRGRTDPDPMLERLMTEALFHVSDTRRWLAAHTLRLSPYNRAIIDHCVELASGPNGLLAARAWDALEVLGPGPGQVLAVALAERRPGLQPAALRTLADSAEPIAEGACDELAALIGRAPDDTQLAAIAALARCAPERLSAITPTSERTSGAVDWWRRLGPVLRDSPHATFSLTQTG